MDGHRQRCMSGHWMVPSTEDPFRPWECKRCMGLAITWHDDKCEHCTAPGPEPVDLVCRKRNDTFMWHLPNTGLWSVSFTEALTWLG